MGRREEILQQIDELENELFNNYDEFMKKDEILAKLENDNSDFIEKYYFSLTKRDLKYICVSALKQLNGTQLINMFKELNKEFVGYDQLMKNKLEIEKKIKKG